MRSPDLLWPDARAAVRDAAASDPAAAATATPMPWDRQQRAAALASVAMAVPEHVVTNATVAEGAGVTEQWIVHRTGVHERRHVSDGERLQDLATAAGRAALAEANVAAEDVDLVLVATVAADAILPNAAPLVARELGATRAGAMDLGAACTGFLSALALAAAQVEGGRSDNVLVIGAEVLSRFIDRSDRGTSALFADGAGAALVAPANGTGFISDIVLHCDAIGADSIRASHEEQIIHMQGHDTFKAAVQRMSESTVEVVGRAGLGLDEIDLFVYHQANARILTAVGEKLGLADGSRDQLHRPLRQHLIGNAPDRPRGRPRARNARAGHERAPGRIRRGFHLGGRRDRMGGMNGRPDGSALVTGASRGIGAAIAKSLAREGWPVGVNYRSDPEAAEAVVEEITSAGGRAKALHGDVSDPDTADALFTALEEEFGPVLVLVNNAGVTADGLAPMIDDDDWNRVIETNLSAAFRLTRRALRPMLRNRYGRVVNIASIVGGVRGNAGPGQLRGLEGRPCGDDQERGRRGGAPRGDRERRGARSDRDRDERRNRGELAGARARPPGRDTGRGGRVRAFSGV